MRGMQNNLVKLMDGPDKRFVIPFFQRKYDWKKVNCEKLYDDLIKTVRHNRSHHFFGSVVSHSERMRVNGKDEYLLIDGQQRITTISLLMLAMSNLLKEGKVTSKKPMLADRIYESYLVDRYEFGDSRIKLVQVKGDREAYHKLFGDRNGYVKQSDLTINYEYFYERIQKNEITIDELYTAISTIQIIDVTTDADDDPQLIFESLNSTGVALSDGDKIRNFVLMGLSREKQEGYYEKYWEPIEKAVGSDVTMFVRDYLSVKNQSIPAKKDIYETFKNYAQMDSETLLRDILKYAGFYEVLLTGKSSYGIDISKDIQGTIKRLNRLGTTVTRPFLMEVLRLYGDGEIEISEVSEIFSTVENYIARRIICEVPTNALNKIFVTLHKDIVRYDGSCAGYVEKMKFILLSKRESGRYPDDDEFLRALSNKNIYNMNSKNRVYVMERFENFGTREVKDVYAGVEDGTYSIEHIMPQHLTPDWIDALGPDYAKIHSTWLHRLANLTLTAYNSKYSNESFLSKKNLVDKEKGIGIGFANSGLRVNSWIAQRDKWTEDELVDRNQYLLDLAKRIWPYVTSKYTPKEKPLESVTLGDDEDLTGRIIVKFAYKGIEQSVKTWVEMYEKILKILHQRDESVMADLAYSDDKDLSKQVSADSKAFNQSIEIDDGIYVSSGISTQYKLTNLAKFFELYGAEPEDLVFYLDE